MAIILAAIVPTIILMILGNMFRRSGFLAVDFWTVSDKLTYYALFPALLITKVSQVDLSAINFSQLLLFIVLYFSIGSLMVYLIYRLTGGKPQQFSSIYQGVLRFNSYVYFAIIEAVWGQQTLALSALIAGSVIPIVNICCIASFSVGSGHLSLRDLSKSIINNPLIIGAILGFLTNIFPVLMPQFLFDSLEILAKAALPLALLSVGAAVRVKMLFASYDKDAYWRIALTTIGRLLFTPLLAYLLVISLGITGDMKLVLILFAAVPTATSSYILSKQLGGDADMMATLISLETIVSVLSLVLWLNILLW